LNLFADTGVRLAKAGYAVFGIDYEGHGKSDGIRCYIKSFEDIVNDCATFFKSVAGMYNWDLFMHAIYLNVMVISVHCENCMRPVAVHSKKTLWKLHCRARWV